MPMARFALEKLSLMSSLTKKAETIVTNILSEAQATEFPSKSDVQQKPQVRNSLSAVANRCILS